MPNGAIWRDPVFINTVGHGAGALLFAAILVLLIRDWRSQGGRRTKLNLIAAGLALGWNMGSLIALAMPASSAIRDSVNTASFLMLSLLPAVLLQITLQTGRRPLAWAGYLLSTTATVLHSGELIWPDSGLHQIALLVIAVGFGALSIAGFITDKTHTQRLSLACLFLFTSSFIHFGYQHDASPWAEVTLHHLGIPVALIVLLRDYRFLLLDTFLRFVVNFGLAALYLASLLGLALAVHLDRLTRRSMFFAGVALVLVCLSLILFAHVRNALQAWMNRVIFRRRSVDDCIRSLQTLALDARSEDDLLLQAARHVAEYLHADHFTFAKAGSDTNSISRSLPMAATPERTHADYGFHAETQMLLRLSSGEARYLMLGPRRGGQRYWSEDLDDMRQLAIAIVEQVERYRAEELKRLVSQAELRALQAQINPHFLFNALNTLYGTIDRHSHEARRMVLNLADIFRYFLQGQRTMIPLAEELKIVEAYLEIEAVRLGDRLRTELHIADEARQRPIPILSVQPLVENAVKHGAAKSAQQCRVCVRAEIVNQQLRVCVEDTGAGFAASQGGVQGGAGVGLENVRRRLRLSFGPDADLSIQSGSSGTSVSFTIPGSNYPSQTPHELVTS